MQFQKISIPTPRKVIRNSDGEEGLKSQFFQGKYEAKLEIQGRWGGGGGGANQKPPGGVVHGYLLESHNPSYKPLNNLYLL